MGPIEIQIQLGPQIKSTGNTHNYSYWYSPKTNKLHTFTDMKIDKVLHLKQKHKLTNYTIMSHTELKFPKIDSFFVLY